MGYLYVLFSLLRITFKLLLLNHFWIWNLLCCWCWCLSAEFWL